MIRARVATETVVARITYFLAGFGNMLGLETVISTSSFNTCLSLLCAFLDILDSSEAEATTCLIIVSNMCYRTRVNPVSLGPGKPVKPLLEIEV